MFEGLFCPEGHDVACCKYGSKPFFLFEQTGHLFIGRAPTVLSMQYEISLQLKALLLERVSESLKTFVFGAQVSWTGNVHNVSMSE